MRRVSFSKPDLNIFIRVILSKLQVIVGNFVSPHFGHFIMFKECSSGTQPSRFVEMKGMCFALAKRWLHESNSHVKLFEVT